MESLAAEAPRHAGPALGDDGLRRLLRCCTYRNGTTVAGFKGYRLGSAVQPIYSFSERRAVGCEALVRATDPSGTSVAPDHLFGSVRRARDLLLLDGLCRLVHMSNFRTLALEGWLFLNVDPATLRDADHGATFFDQAIDYFGLAREQVVVEILEKRIPDERVLAETVALYRSFGCLVALDDFGVGQSNFDRIWRLAPEIVKLDRQLLAHACDSDRVRRSLPNLVHLLHEAGCMVLAEGVEREDEALLALDAGVDLAQGYFFARPQTIVDDQPLALSVCAEPHPRFDSASESLARRHAELLRPYRQAFERLVQGISRQGPVDAEIAVLLKMEQTTGFWVMDTEGRPLRSSAAFSQAGAEFPAGAACTANHDGWQRRPCLRKALAEPGTVQFTGPYRSRQGNTVCSTFSCAVGSGTETLVLCLDLREPRTVHRH